VRASVVTARDAVANRTEDPMKLTDTQLVLLSAASRREDGAIVLAPNLKGSAAPASCGVPPSTPMLTRPRSLMRSASGPASSSRRHTGSEPPAGTSSISPSRRSLPPTLPGKPNRPSRGRIAHLRIIGIRSPVERRRGVSLHNSRPKRVAAHRSRPACSQCCSASRAQPSLLS